MSEPLPVCYLNGVYQPLRDARVSPLDRGFLFGDGVYEVLPAYAGRMFRFQEHFDRLERSLNAIRLTLPHTHERWRVILQELVRRNGSVDMSLYVQVTRGMEYGRNHAFPAHVTPSVFAMAAPLPIPSKEQLRTGCAAITIEDFRWERCDIKSTSLLANVLMKQQAVDAGVQEAIILRDGEVLEGASSNVFVVQDGRISTPPDSHRILPGITRDAVRELAPPGLEIHVRRIAVQELRGAEEVWISSSIREILAVISIDGRPVGAGAPGPVWKHMHQIFQDARGENSSEP